MINHSWPWFNQYCVITLISTKKSCKSQSFVIIHVDHLDFQLFPLLFFPSFPRYTSRGFCRGRSVAVKVQRPMARRLAAVDAALLRRGGTKPRSNWPENLMGSLGLQICDSNICVFLAVSEINAFSKYAWFWKWGFGQDDRRTHSWRNDVTFQDGEIWAGSVFTEIFPRRSLARAVEALQNPFAGESACVEVATEKWQEVTTVERYYCSSCVAKCHVSGSKYFWTGSDWGLCVCAVSIK